MKQRVGDIMSCELFAVGPADAVDMVRASLLSLGITGVPVVDAERRPLGMVSLRDILSCRDAQTAADLMTEPAVTIPATATVDETARKLLASGLRRLAVVDAEGRVVGVASAIDVVRGLVGDDGHRTQKPSQADDVAFSESAVLDMDEVQGVAAAPGILLLVQGKKAASQVVWAEASMDLRARLLDLLSLPQRDHPRLEQWLRQPNLRFRVAEIGAEVERQRVLGSVLRRIDPNPQMQINPQSLKRQ